MVPNVQKQRERNQNFVEIHVSEQNFGSRREREKECESQREFPQRGINKEKKRERESPGSKMEPKEGNQKNKATNRQTNW